MKLCPYNEPFHDHHDGCPSCDNPVSMNVDDLTSFDALSAKVKKFTEQRARIIEEAGLDDIAPFDEQQYWEDRSDNNPDDGSWIGR